MQSHLLRLLAENRNVSGTPAALRGIRAEKATAGDSTTVYLYDAVVSDDFWGGVSAKAVANTLAGISTPKIEMRINSPGGDVFAGKTIASLMKAHPSEIVAHVDGVAASAASLIAIAADQLVMEAGSFLMIHRAWTLIAGNFNDMIEAAGVLEKIDQSLAEEYAAVSGKTVAEAMAWMDAETWFSGQEALDAGLADHAESSDPKGEGAQARWKLGAYKNAPAAAQVREEQKPALLVPANVWADRNRLLRVIEQS
jgi:ATP-dependent Clp protease protease subunit